MLSRVLFTLLPLALLCSACPDKGKTPATASPPTTTSEDEKPTAAPVHGLFGFSFADRTGKRLLALDHLEQPKAAEKAVCRGTIMPLRYIGRQERTSDDTGRDTAANFDNLAGDVFSIIGDQASEDAICMLVDSRFLREHSLLRTVSSAELTKKERDAIESIKKRRISRSWELETLENGRSLQLVLFERQELSALASIVFVEPDRITFLDFPGSYEDDSSVWRVDDGGELEGWMFDIIAVFESAGKIEFAYRWSGAEGMSIAYVREENGRLAKVLTSYKYHSPL